ncbi:MAG TPA: AAA family ATPase [Sedimentisphaerales bacterium]|nr:AAA family ATPase [Sedimentisphaerales bacterium]
MTPAELVLSKLQDAKRNGSGWIARCPAHDDGRASLSVAVGEDGRALVHCHAGCTPEAIVSAMGLKLADLMPGDNGKPRAPRRAESKAKTKTTDGRRKNASTVYAAAEDAIAELERKHGPHSAQWTYHNAAGEPVGMIVRWDADGGKDIRPLAKTAKGWIIGGMPEPRPLYRLPELLARSNERVFVCEGEKAADAAASVGLLATTSPHGSESAKTADWTPLTGREVIILPDNDDAGQGYARAVISILLGLDPATTVKVVELPNLPPKGDIYDWVEARDATEPDALRAQVERLVDATSPIDASEVLGGPILTCLAYVEPVEVRWLWPGRVPLGRITLLVGRPGEGKSLLTTYMASRVTTGSPWADGAACPKGAVILISAEDDPADTIRPRLDAHHANVRRVHLLAMVRKVGDNGERKEVMFTLADVDALEAALKVIPDCKLVVVDPIGSFLGGRTDAHRDNEVRAVLAPVAKLAEKYGVAVVVVAHRRKGGGTFADDLALGSRAFTGIARAVWHLTRDRENKRRRLLLPGKNNLAAEGGGLAFTIVGDPPAISWERDPVTMTADDALATENGNEKQKPGPKPKARDRAVEWLRDLLKDGPLASAKILQEGKEAGYSSRTLHRAKDELGIKPYREQFGGAWMWKLPPTVDDTDGMCHDP